MVKPIEDLIVEAMDEGYESYQRGLDRSSNDYPVGVLREAWDDGWNSRAAEDDEDDEDDEEVSDEGDKQKITKLIYQVERGALGPNNVSSRQPLTPTTVRQYKKLFKQLREYFDAG